MTSKCPLIERRMSPRGHLFLKISTFYPRVQEIIYKSVLLQAFHNTNLLGRLIDPCCHIGMASYNQPVATAEDRVNNEETY